MRLRHIEVFHAVYTSGSVTRAAEFLNVSQPSVSKVLAHAEQQLGYALFDRVRGKLVPTPEADKLYLHVGQVNDSVDRLRRVARNLKAAEQGTIRIAATPAFGVDFLPMAIAAYLQVHEDVQFMVETRHLGELANGLLESRLDLGLAFDPDETAGITVEVLGRGSFVALTPPGAGLGEAQRLTIPELARFPFIRLDDEGPLGRLLSNYIDSSGAQFNTVSRVQTYHVAKALVSYGAGVTIVDEVTARSGGHGNVKVWPLEPRLKFRIAVMRIEQTPLSLPCRHFLEHLRLCLGDFLGSSR